MGRDVNLTADITYPALKVDLAPPFKDMNDSYVEVEVAQHDAVSINFTVTQNGQPFNLTGYTVALRAKEAVEDTTYVINKTATIVSATAGTCRVDLTASDLSEAATLTAQLYLGLNGATITAYRGPLTIVPSV